MLDALHGELSFGPVLAVEELLERPSSLRGVIGEEPPGDVRVALVGDGVVLVRRQPDTLEHREGTEDVAKVGRDLEDVAVLLLDSLEVAGELRNLRVRAARSLEELLPPDLHVLHALELLTNLLDLILVREAELGAETLGAATLGERREQKPDGARHAQVLHSLPLTGGNETHGVQITWDSLKVLAHEVSDEAEDGGAQVLAHGGHETPVQDAQLAVVGAEEVTRVGIRVKRPDVEQHRQVTRERHRTQPWHVALLGRVQPLPVDPAGGENTPGGRGRHDGRGGDDAREVWSRLHREPELLTRRRLLPVVQLVYEPDTPLVHERLEVGVESLELPPRLRERADDADVERDGDERARPLHLHRHLLRRPVRFLQRTAVHLPEGRGCDGCRAEAEVPGARGSELRGEDALGEVVVKRGHGILERPQFLDVGSREEVLAAAQHLAELDVRGTE